MTTPSLTRDSHEKWLSEIDKAADTFQQNGKTVSRPLVPLLDSKEINEKFPKLKQAYQKAKIHIMNRGSKMSFYASVCFGLHHGFTVSEKIQTMATDGKWIYINPNFFLKGTTEDQSFVLLHETAHVMFNHCATMQHAKIVDPTIDLRVMNIAQDYVINAALVNSGIPMPSPAFGGLYDPKYSNKTSIEVYKELIGEHGEPQDAFEATVFKGQSQQSFEASAGAPKSTKGNSIQDVLDVLLPASENDPSPDTDPDNPSDVGKYKSQHPNIDETPQSEDFKRKLLNAAMHTGSDGFSNIPAAVQIQIKNLKQPILDWKRILYKHVRATLKSGMNWSKPNRRYFPEIHAPTVLKKPRLDHINIAIDLSSSVSDTDIEQFVSEVHGIMSLLNPKKITVLEFNTRVTQTTDFTSIAAFKQHEFIGRGGTLIDPVLRAHNKNPARALIIFTDGDFNPPRVTVNEPVFWIIDKNPDFTAGFGKVIHTTNPS